MKKNIKELASLLFVFLFLGSLFLISRPKTAVAEHPLTTDVPASTASDTPAPAPAVPSYTPAAVSDTAPAATSADAPVLPAPTPAAPVSASPKAKKTPKKSAPKKSTSPKPASARLSAPKTANTTICQIHNSTRDIKKVLADVTYNGKKISLKNTPLIQYKNVIMAPLHTIFVKNGPQVSYELEKTTKHIRLEWHNKLVTFSMQNSTLYYSGQKMTLPTAPVNAVYSSGKTTEQMVPFLSLCEALEISCKWNPRKGSYILKGKKNTFSGKKTYTKYAYSRKAFARKEYNASKRTSYKKYLDLITPSKDTTSNFKFLRIDQYRSVDTKKFRDYYQYLIEDYCRQRKISTQKSSLYNKADIFLKAAKQYNIDPVYLVSQTFLESAYGTSELASGYVVKKVAYRNFRRKRNGKFQTKKLKHSVKVYNLYGIKAYDSDPHVGASSYAYYHKWISPERAIYGAAHYLNTHYIRGSFRQNTLFKMRFTFRSSLWHQYATSPEYAENIGKRHYLMSSCYAKNTSFLYDFPKYRS